MFIKPMRNSLFSRKSRAGDANDRAPEPHRASFVWGIRSLTAGRPTSILVQWMLHRNIWQEDVVQELFDGNRCTGECCTGKIVQVLLCRKILYRSYCTWNAAQKYPTGNVVQEMLYRNYCTGNVGQEIVYRNMLYRKCYTGKCCTANVVQTILYKKMMY